MAFVQEISRKRLWHFNFGSLFVDEPHYRNKISGRLKALKQATSFNAAISETDIAPYIKRNVLELLLAECNRIKIENKARGSTFKIADDLCDLVRHYLQIYHPEFHFHISLQAYLPQAFHLPANAYSLFTCDRKDGWLYLDYVGKGQDSLGAFNEKSIAGHQPQNFFSANCQLLYRDNFEGRALQNHAVEWLKANNQSDQSVGLIPLARPLHGYTRTQVRELFANSANSYNTLEIRILSDGKKVADGTLGLNTPSLNPYYSAGATEAAGKWLLRKTNLDLPVNFLIDWYHHYGFSLWLIKKPYYWLKPRAYRAYFVLSWPIRIVIYYFKFQMSVGFIDYRTLAKVYVGRIFYAVKWPFHFIRPHAFKIYFAVSLPIRKAFYFAKFQFEKRILRSRK